MKNSLIHLFYEAEDYFFRSLSKQCLDFNELTTAYLTGVNLGSDNPLYIRKNISTIEDILNDCDSFYKANGVPWDVIVTAEFMTNDLKQHSQNLGLKFIGKSVAMFLELNKTHYLTEERFTIQQVDDKLNQING